MLIFITGALIGYHSFTYGIIFDEIMIQNILETNFSEACELISWSYVGYVALFGLLPSYLIYKLGIKEQSPKIFYKEKVFVCFISLSLALALFFSFYKDNIALHRNYKQLRQLLVPFRFYWSSYNYCYKSFYFADKGLFKISDDASLQNNQTKNGKKNIIIFIVGEAARAQSFGLNGYTRDTTPLLNKSSVLNYKNFHSCGTSTSISVPCIFSHLGRKQFDVKQSYKSENLLDILKKLDFQITWYDNNSSSKGVALRVTKEIDQFDNTQHCLNGSCFDAVLLDALTKHFPLKHQNNFIVLHQKGNHGPAYYLRYPKAFEKFKPVCKSTNFKNCTQEEIINAYDNAILYTDFQIAELINLLQYKEAEYNSAVVYVSDHGESTGEKGIYLHGLPYMIAPKEQTHIPFIMWFSNGFINQYQINLNCLHKATNTRLSHDNIFHSLLGLLNIKSLHYNKALDVFASCKS
jgi:lipid A ethanolaminephosphotransferase